MKIFFSLLSFIVISGFGLLYAEETGKPAATAEEIRNNSQPVQGEKKTEAVPSEKEVKTPVESVKKEAEDKPLETPQKESVKESADQKRDKTFEYRSYNSFGLNISSYSGIGLSYRYHMDAPLLFQLTGGVISEGESHFYAVGAEVQKELSKSKDKRAFGSLAVGIYGERYKENSVEYYTGMVPPEKWVSDNAYSFAIGVGGELAFGS